MITRVDSSIISERRERGMLKLYYIHNDNDNKRMKKADKVVSMFESHHNI